MTDLAGMHPARRVTLPGGGWLHVHVQAGHGPTLLLLHGFTDCAESYRLLLPHLAGRHVVIPDLRGHGQSFRGSIDSLDGFCRDIEALASALSLKGVTLVGHSMGALIAVRLAARGRLSLGALITLSGSVAPAGPALDHVAAQFTSLPTPLPVDHPFLDEWYACETPFPVAFGQTLRRSCANMRPEDWRACLAILSTADLSEDAECIATPTLVIGGEADPLFPEAHQIALAAALHGAARRHLRGVGHNPHWEKPELVAQMLLGFERERQIADPRPEIPRHPASNAG